MLRNFRVLCVFVAVVGYATGVRAQEYSSFLAYPVNAHDRYM